MALLDIFLPDASIRVTICGRDSALLYSRAELYPASGQVTIANKRAGQEREDRVPAAGSKRAEEALRQIVDGITSQVGEQFFRALVRHLAAALKVRFAFVSEQLDHDGARLRLVAFWAGDDYGENFEYPTKGTPCAQVVGKGLACFPSGLRELFPEDAWLREVGAESYLAVPLFDSTRGPLGHLGVMHDEPMDEELLNEQILRIFAERAGGELERKRAEEALRESEERYRELVENINDVIYEVDTSGRVTYISPVAEEVSGYSPNEIIGRSIVEFMPPEEVPARMDSFREGLSGRLIPTEFSLLCKSGEIRRIHTSGRVIREGDRITGFRGVLTDITERKRAEEALRDSEERLKILFESAPDAYYLNDLEGRFVDGNRAAGEISGYKGEELIGQNFLSLNLLSPDEISKAAALLARNAQGEATGPDEFTLNRKDGSQVPVEIRTFVVRITGEVLVLGIARDITERKRAEEAVQQSREELESRVESQMQKGNAYGLTFRELTVVHLVAAGKPDKEIGTLLGISPRTANKHVQNILTKMGASSRTEAGVRAVREGLVE